MSFTANDVINGARIWHPSFDKPTHSDSVAFDWLNSFIRVERRKLQSLVPEMVLSQTTVPLPLLIPFAAGAQLPGLEQLFQVVAMPPDTGGDIRGDLCEMVPLEHLPYQGTFPAVAWVGGTISSLYLRGVASDWSGYDHLLVDYVVNPDPVTTLEQGIALPSPLLDVCIAGLCCFFAMRGGSERVGPSQQKYFAMKEQEARLASDMAMASQRAGETWRILEKQ